MKRARPKSLKGLRVLIVEDQYLIADDLRRAVTELGAAVVGPCATVEAAIAKLTSEPVQFGLLDLGLRGEQVLPVADELVRRGVPFAFATGYEEWMIPARYRGHPRIAKPASPGALREVLEAGLKR